MKQFLLLVPLYLLLVSSSCDEPPAEKDISGKWYSFYETDYIESRITDTAIFNFSETGNLGWHNYLIVEDSIKYPGTQYSAKLIRHSDSILVLKSSASTDTLYRLPDSVTMFSEINYKDDSLFAEFYEDFTGRRWKHLVKHGYFTKEEAERILPDTTKLEVEEELIEITHY